MAGSGRVPDPDESKRAQVGKRKPIYESEMALFFECMPSCAQTVLDSADIVRDRDFTSTTSLATFRVADHSGLKSGSPQGSHIYLFFNRRVQFKMMSKG